LTAAVYNGEERQGIAGGERGKVVNEPRESFSGKCPQCQGYNSRIRTEVINYSQEETIAEADQQPIASRTRIFFCNSCQNVWSETVPGR
jgi:Zn finger protein HypA/HybF involved in hydrogenase expression